MPIKKPYAPARSSKKKLTKVFVTRQATEWWQHESRKMLGSRLCDRCEAVWFDGHWHTAPKMAAMLRAAKKKSGKAKPMLCYECHLAVHGPANPKEGLFEGQLTLDGLEDAKEKAEILSTVRNFGARASKRDPEDRIIAIDDRGKRVVVTTTENQMVVGMGKAVHSAFKGGVLKISWSKEDALARVNWNRRKA